MALSFETVKILLADCIRQELRDHAFGDSEVYWEKNGKEIASGYFGGGHASVIMYTPTGAAAQGYEGARAKELRYLGTEGHITRNDEMGPDTYQEGYIMPGLTLEGVKEELTRRPV